MNDTSVRFELVRRGYHREQVDNLVTQVVGDRDKALARITALEQRVKELTAETGNAQTHFVENAPSFAGLGARVEEILRLAEEEAAELGDEAREAARDHHKVVGDAAERIQAEAAAYAARLKATSNREGTRIADTAQAEAARLHTEAHASAQAARNDADGFFEDTRARAAHAAPTSRPSSPNTANRRRATSPPARPKVRNGSTSSSNAPSNCAWKPRSGAETPSTKPVRAHKTRSTDATTSSLKRTPWPTGSAANPNANSPRSPTAATASTRS